MAGTTSTHSKGPGKRGGGRGSGGSGDGMTEYEKQRLSRIRENRERMEALGLPILASSLLGSSGCGKQGQQTREEGETDSGKTKRNKKGYGENEDDEDGDYHPSDGNEGGENSSSGEEETDDDEEGEEERLVSPSGARRTPKGKGQKKNSLSAVKVGKQLSIQQRMDELDVMDDDVALRQAIAMSLGEPMRYSGVDVNMISQVPAGVSTSTKHHEKHNGTRTQGTTGGGKRKKWNVKRPQMTEDELVAYFFSFDEAGKGSIMLHDLMKVAAAHDFSWTHEEMADMIYLFDGDKDGKLTLDDFRTIVCRCHMMQEPGSC